MPSNYSEGVAEVLIRCGGFCREEVFRGSERFPVTHVYGDKRSLGAIVPTALFSRSPIHTCERFLAESEIEN